VVRNEEARLPFILKYYSELGVGRFFVIDNGSTDRSRDLLLAHPNTHVFSTEDIFTRKQWWIDLLLHRYGNRHWCLLVDADEILVYPHCNTVPLKTLCSMLEKEGYRAMDFFLLDLYPDGPVATTPLPRRAQDLAEVSYFDPFYTQQPGIEPPVDKTDDTLIYSGPYRAFGGMRKRIFGINPCLSKFALFKFDKTMAVNCGAHVIECSSIAPLRGALLHFKWFGLNIPHLREEVSRAERWRSSAEYKTYLRNFTLHPDLNLRDSKSVKYHGPSQLTRYAIMQSHPRLDALAASQAKT